MFVGAVCETPRERQYRTELEFERSQVRALKDELFAARKAQQHAPSRHRSFEGRDALVYASVEHLHTAIRSSMFETLRHIVPEKEGVCGRRNIVVPWTRITSRSVVHVSCCEAYTPTVNAIANDYVGFLGEARISIHSLACGDGVVTLDLDCDWPHPLNLMVTVTNLGEPSQYYLNNSGDRLDLFPVESLERIRSQHLRNLVALDESSDLDFIQAVYQRFLLRSADVEGLSHFENLLRTAKLSREELIEKFINSPEYAKRHATSP